MMDDRFQKEANFFDSEAEHLLPLSDKELAVNDPRRHLAGSAIAFDYMFESLGDLNGKRIMELGSGSGWFAVFLAQQGAREVIGYEISPRMVQVGERRANLAGFSNQIEFRRQPVEDMPVEDVGFDLIVGISVLHHVDLDSCKETIRRCLKPDGKCIFIEPLGQSRLTRFARERVFSRFFSTSDDEEPLTFADIEAMSDMFSVRHLEFQILGGLARIVGDDLADRFQLNRLDNFLLSRFGGLADYCRLTVIELTANH